MRFGTAHSSGSLATGAGEGADSGKAAGSMREKAVAEVEVAEVEGTSIADITVRVERR